MKTLLRIDASIRLANSTTRRLTDYFEEVWLRENPEGEVIRRCLATDPVPHLCQEAYEAFQSDVVGSETSSMSDLLIDEIKRSDHIVIGSPLYNLSLPSTLKSYFDHIVRAGETFEVKKGSYRGLLGNKQATLITARGGYASTDCLDDFQTDYLRQILAFIGISRVEVVAMESAGDVACCKTEAIAQAKQEIDQLCALTQYPIWIGEFSDQDRQAIRHLRVGQAEAIVAGDANAYAALCADDIQLLIPARELVLGKRDFLQTEEALFKNARFVGFYKFPLHVERSGDLAIEVGHQQVKMNSQEYSGGVYSACQKYVHVFRNTSQGWRFALLMSNPNE